MNGESKTRGVVSVASRNLPDGRLVELLYKPEPRSTCFAVYDGGRVQELPSVDAPGDARLVPMSRDNNLIRHEAILLPACAEPYDSVASLTKEIGDYVHRYVDLSDSFQQIAIHYVLLSWVHDAFNELPYLRFRGDFGSGKTRALSVIGSICYRPFFASGASTVSPVFHILDAFGGTLVLDEADFRFSDEKSELVKILNNGNVRGFPVLRTAVTQKREFDPRAFQVFGPKIIAMRQSFDDPALESRFLTEDMGHRKLRDDIPINLPQAQKEEATHLRNKLLTYRFENLAKAGVTPELVDASLSARQNQILTPLLSVAADEAIRDVIREATKSFDALLYGERSSTLEAGVLEIVLEKLTASAGGNVPIADIAKAFRERYTEEQERPLSNREIGGILRRRLRIATYKSHGIYVVPASELEKVSHIAERYGLRA